jgi:hypothetical protein
MNEISRQTDRQKEKEGEGEGDYVTIIIGGNTRDIYYFTVRIDVMMPML